MKWVEHLIVAALLAALLVTTNNLHKERAIRWAETHDRSCDNNYAAFWWDDYTGCAQLWDEKGWAHPVSEDGLPNEPAWALQMNGTNCGPILVHDFGEAFAAAYGRFQRACAKRSQPRSIGFDFYPLELEEVTAVNRLHDIAKAIITPPADR